MYAQQKAITYKTICARRQILPCSKTERRRQRIPVLSPFNASPLHTQQRFLDQADCFLSTRVIKLYIINLSVCLADNLGEQQVTTPPGFGGKPTQLLSPCSLRWQLQRDQDVEKSHEIKGLQTLEPTLHSSADQPELLTWMTKPRSSLSMMSSYKPSVKQRMPSRRSNVSPTVLPPVFIFWCWWLWQQYEYVTEPKVCCLADSVLLICLVGQCYCIKSTDILPNASLDFWKWFALRNFHTRTKSASLPKCSQCQVVNMAALLCW